jgi:predicted ribosomally synthesized peptide with nif11-like leader
MEQKLAQLQAKLEADNSLVEKLFALETPEEVQSFLKDQGLDFSLEEINTVREALVKNLEKGEGELSDADLENVAGGVAVTAVIGAVCAIAGAIFGAGNFVNNVTRGRW